MIVEHVLKLLEEAGTGTGGVDLFAHDMSASITAGILVLNQLSGNTINYELPNWRKDDPFQVIIRNPSNAAARVLAETIRSALVITKDTWLVSLNGIPDIRLTYIRQTSDPIVYPRSVANLWEVSLNYKATYLIAPLNPLNTNTV